MSDDGLPLVWVHMDPGAARPVCEGRALLIGPGVDERTTGWDGIEAADAALLSTVCGIDRRLLEAAPRLKVVSRFGTGTDNVDVAAATSLGICVTHNPDAMTQSVAELTVGLMFALARRLIQADAAVNRGEWEVGRSLVGFEIAGKTLGVIGAGRIGGRVASIARSLGMRVLAFDPIAPSGQLDRLAAEGVQVVDSLDKLVPQSDVLSLHVPATRDTAGLASARFLSLMKPGALLINVARGSVLNESALAEALDSGRIAGAALDVLSQEPPPADHPLLGRPNVIVTPHIAGGTGEVIERTRREAAEQALMVLNGVRPPWLVDPSVWERRR